MKSTSKKSEGVTESIDIDCGTIHNDSDCEGEEVLVDSDCVVEFWFKDSRGIVETIRNVDTERR